MFRKRIVVDKVLLLASLIPSVANMASLVLVPTMRIELIVAVEPLSTETTLGMPLEAALIDGPWIIISELLVLTELTNRKELVLVGEDLLVSCTEIAHDFVMHALDMSVQVRPAKTGNIAILIGAIVPK